MVYQRFKCLFSFPISSFSLSSHIFVCVSFFLFDFFINYLESDFFITFCWGMCAFVCCPYYLIVHWTMKLVNFMNEKRFPVTVGKLFMTMSRIRFFSIPPRQREKAENRKSVKLAITTNDGKWRKSWKCVWVIVCDWMVAAHIREENNG